MSDLSDAQAAIQRAEDARDRAVEKLRGVINILEEMTGHFLLPNNDLDGARAEVAEASNEASDALTGILQTIEDKADEGAAACRKAIEQVQAEIGKIQAVEIPNYG